MKTLVLVAVALMSSVAYAGNKDPIDADCAKMATNARGFAELKAGGIATTPDQLQHFVVTPSVQSYPIQSILEYVMGQTDASPEQVYNNLYHKCTLMGYKDLLAYFLEREQIGRLQIQLALKDQQIAGLRQQNTILTQENTQLKYPPAPQRHVTHVTPPAPQPVAVVPTPVVERTLTYVPPAAAQPGCHLADGTPCAKTH